MHCNYMTSYGRLCSNYKSNGDKCYIHKNIRCCAITKRGKQCKNSSYAINKCYVHLPTNIKKELIRLDDINDEIIILKNEMKTKNKQKSSVMFDLGSNQTKIVSRYIHTFKKWDNGTYIYEKETENYFNFNIEYEDFLDIKI